MDTPLVSVLIPAYNAEATLGAALDSALAQTWPRVEVVVVDDGSSDRTADVAASYAERGVRVLSQVNAGAAAARNTALGVAEGDFVQFFDADDVLSPGKLEAQVRRLHKEPAGTLATGPWVRFYGEHPEAGPFPSHPDFRDYEDPLDWRIDSWTGRGVMPPLAWLVPRAIADAAGPWHEGLSLDDDGEYFTRVVLAARKIAFCESAWGHYRSGHESLSSQRSRRALESQFEAVRLSTGHLLAHEDSPRTRHAAACYWQTFTFMAYPDVPDLVATAEACIDDLGGGSLSPGGGRAFRALRRVAGWKAAVRLQQAYRHLRYP